MVPLLRRSLRPSRPAGQRDQRNGSAIICGPSVAVGKPVAAVPICALILGTAPDRRLESAAPVDDKGRGAREEEVGPTSNCGGSLLGKVQRRTSCRAVTLEIVLQFVCLRPGKDTLP